MAVALESQKVQKPVRFGEHFELDPREYELRRSGRHLKIEPTPMAILWLLIERRGELVTREEIAQRIWGDSVYVDTDNSINGAIRKIRQVLDDDPGKPLFIQTVSGKGYRFVAEVSTEEETKPRLAVVPAPPSVHVESSGSAPPWWKQKWVLLVAGVACISVIAGIIGYSSRTASRRRLESTSSATKVRRSIAVLGLQNLSGKPEQEWISTALQETLNTELASGQELRVIPDESVARLKSDLTIPAANSYGRETLEKIRAHLNTDYVVLGSYLATGKDPGQKVRVNLQLQDTRTGETVGVVSQDGTEVDIAELASRSGANLRQSLGVSAVARTDMSAVPISIPKDPEAARFYAEGLAKLHVFDALSARVLLEKAIAKDPSHALSHAALAESWSALGYDARAREEAKKAFDLSEGLSREERLSIEGKYRDLSRDFASAAEIYKTLNNFFPDSVEYGLRLAMAQLKADRAKDTLGTLQRLRALPEPESKDARIDLVETNACEALSDFRGMQRIAASAAEKGRLQGSRLLVAEAREREGRAWIELGEYDKAEESLLEARNLFAASGNPRESSVAAIDLADLLYAKGDNVAAHHAYEEAVRGFRATGAQQQLANSLSREGSLFYDEGKLAEAKRSQEQALKIDREIGNGTERDLSSLANVLDALGDLDSAVHRGEEALDGFRKQGDKNNEAVTLANLAGVQIKTGDIAAANRNIEQATAIQRATGHKRGLGFSLFFRAQILSIEDRLQESQATAQQTIDLRKELKDDLHIPESELLLAEVMLERDKSGDAQPLVERAAAAFEKQGVTDLAAQSYADLTRALLAQGKLVEATAAADRSLALSKKGGDLTATFEAKLARASVIAQSGKTAEASKQLSALRDELSQHRYVNYELEVRLMLGEIELRSNKIDDGRAHLSSLEQDARSTGFLLIARKAASALQNSRNRT